MSALQVVPIPRQLVVFRVGETHYALDIEVVDEILALLPITPVAGAPRGILGVADVRKRVIPVFDLHVKFGVPRPADDNESRLILVDPAGVPVAFLVDAVEEVITVQGEEFQQVLPPGNREALGYLSGILRRDDRLVLWVDPLGLAPEGLSALEAAAA